MGLNSSGGVYRDFYEIVNCLENIYSNINSEGNKDKYLCLGLNHLINTFLYLV